MKIVIANILIFLLVVGTISCKKNSALEYENDPALYFENTTYGQRDSIAILFSSNRMIRCGIPCLLRY